MSLTATPPPAASPGLVTPLQVATADDPYTAPAVQVWRSTGTAAPAAQAAAGSARATVAPVPGDAACTPPPATVTPATAPPIQVWWTAGPDPAPPAADQAAPCGHDAQADALAGSVDELSGKPLQLDAASRQRWAPAIQHVAVTYQLEPALLHAVISAESGYDPQAHSPKGARGLMQLMPDTARRFGVSDAYDPTANLQGGARYLRWLLDLFNDLRLALAAYNAGEGAVLRSGNTIPPYPETRTYVRRVLEFYRQYRRTP